MRRWCAFCALLLSGAAAFRWSCEDVSPPYLMTNPEFKTECEGLREIDRALNYAPTDLLHWGPDAGTTCAWPGVSCDGNMQVAGLELGGGGLNGTLSGVDMTKLSALQILVLNENEIRGPVPPSLESLSKLIQLDLSANNFTGPVPNINAFAAIEVFLVAEVRALATETGPEKSRLLIPSTSPACFELARARPPPSSSRSSPARSPPPPGLAPSSLSRSPSPAERVHGRAARDRPHALAALL